MGKTTLKILLECLGTAGHVPGAILLLHPEQVVNTAPDRLVARPGGPGPQQCGNHLSTGIRVTGAILKLRPAAVLVLLLQQSGDSLLEALPRLHVHPRGCPGREQPGPAGAGPPAGVYRPPVNTQQPEDTILGRAAWIEHQPLHGLPDLLARTLKVGILDMQPQGGQGQGGGGEVTIFQWRAVSLDFPVPLLLAGLPKVADQQFTGPGLPFPIRCQLDCRLGRRVGATGNALALLEFLASLKKKIGREFTLPRQLRAAHVKSPACRQGHRH